MHYTEHQRDLDLEQRLVRHLTVNTLMARLLINRGVGSVEQAERYLNLDLDNLHSPESLPNVDKAVDRIIRAIKSKEKIFVHGDYDVDGITSTALYCRTLEKLGTNLLSYVPHRQRDGYDLKKQTIQYAYDNGCTLVLTTDCGIQAVDAVDRANELGIDVIITDHHEPGKTLPNAYCIVNPHLPGSQYPFPDIAGVTVAYKLMQRLMQMYFPAGEKPFLRSFIDLVACGTIADVMPLRDENRILVGIGLEAMRRTKKIGLARLICSAGIDITKPIPAQSIGFGIGPRINAIGRLGEASDALELMLTRDPEVATKIVDRMNNFNESRQQLQAEMHQQVEQAIRDQRLDQDDVIVVQQKGWHKGVVGIVAGKIAEQYGKPTIVLSVGDDGVAHGSARSAQGYDLFGGIEKASALTISAGGHSEAAGLSALTTDVRAIQSLVEQDYRSVQKTLVRPALWVDATVAPSIMTLQLLREFERLEPLGKGNPTPSFASTIQLNNCKRIGKDKSHLKFELLNDQGRIIDGVAWSCADLWEPRIHPHQNHQIVYTPQINQYRGKESVQFVIKEIEVC